MNKPLNWDTFIEECFNDERINVLETNPEESYITIEDINDTDPVALTELFVLAYDCNVTVGSSFVGDNERYNGTVDFYE